MGERTRKRKFPKRDQVAPEIVDFSRCVLEGREPENSGREGLADVRIIRALYRSAVEGRRISLSKFEKKKRPSLRQELRRPPVRREPKLVATAAPGD